MATDDLTERLRAAIERSEELLWCETCRDTHGPSGPHAGEILPPEKAELLREIDQQHAAELDAFFAEGPAAMSEPLKFFDSPAGGSAVKYTYLAIRFYLPNRSSKKAAETELAGALQAVVESIQLHGVEKHLINRYFDNHPVAEIVESALEERIR